MTKQERLKQLKAKIEADKTLPLRSGATQLVFGEGNPDTRVYFLGEAPGFFEDKIGRPFVGQAGKLLDRLIERIGLTRSDVYISNVVRFRPPANRDPEPEEIAAFAPYVDEEIAIINPEVVVTLGRFSMGKFLPEVKISQVHGGQYSVDFGDRKVTVLPMYHPAAALRNGAVMKTLASDFMVIRKVLDEPDSAKVAKVEDNGVEEVSQLDSF